ncbi:hypothetical protein PILCRDRAFT_137470 [Piloderma croceum F 1598]|uniref:Uncharacterized protein n=1 Tax=Piloderma croceum (strain F 1598) TaxID=765440 RepID=A0A0C3G644_PILCF|nr:hypothetical protein PILCRDRAFT_137470 [Piloderma croceum F 1598]
MCTRDIAPPELKLDHKWNFNRVFKFQSISAHLLQHPTLVSFLPKWHLSPYQYLLVPIGAASTSVPSFLPTGVPPLVCFKNFTMPCIFKMYFKGKGGIPIVAAIGSVVGPYYDSFIIISRSKRDDEPQGWGRFGTPSINKQATQRICEACVLALTQLC